MLHEEKKKLNFCSIFINGIFLEASFVENLIELTKIKKYTVTENKKWNFTCYIFRLILLQKFLHN